MDVCEKISPFQRRLRASNGRKHTRVITVFGRGGREHVSFAPLGFLFARKTGVRWNWRGDGMGNADGESCGVGQSDGVAHKKHASGVECRDIHFAPKSELQRNRRGTMSESMRVLEKTPLGARRSANCAKGRITSRSGETISESWRCRK